MTNGMNAKKEELWMTSETHELKLDWKEIFGGHYVSQLMGLPQLTIRPWSGAWFEVLFDGNVVARAGSAQAAKSLAEDWLAMHIQGLYNSAQEIGLIEKTASAEEVLAAIGWDIEGVAQLAAVRKKIMDAWPKPKEDR